MLIVAGRDPGEARAEADAGWAAMTPAEHVAAYLAEHPGAKKLDAVKAVAKLRGVPRNDIYQAVLEQENK